MSSTKLNFLRGLFSSKDRSSLRIDEDTKSLAHSDSFRKAEGDDAVVYNANEDLIYGPIKPTGNPEIVQRLEEFSKQSHTWSKIRMAVASQDSFELENALSFVSACEQLLMDQNNIGLALKIRAVFVEKDCMRPVELSQATLAALRSGYTDHFSVFADARLEVLNQLSLVPAIE
jgi:hypothetical protein